MTFRALSPLWTSCLLWTLVSTAAGAADKSAFSLSRPTPPEFLREMTTDRPDFTESPFTVDAGHVQLETDFASLARNHVDGSHSSELGIATFNVRLGLSPDFEAGVFISPYIRHRETPRAAASETHSGFGDITLRGKLNFWGNDTGETAFGLIIDLKLPTASRSIGNGALEGSVVLPINFKLSSGWELAAMTELDVIESGGGTGRDIAWANSVSVGHEITKRLGGYVELTSLTGPGTPALTADAGLTWSVSDNTQLDAGVNIGITRAAEDIVFFAGLSRRF